MILHNFALELQFWRHFNSPINFRLGFLKLSQVHKHSHLYFCLFDFEFTKESNPVFKFVKAVLPLISIPLRRQSTLKFQLFVCLPCFKVYRSFEYQKWITSLYNSNIRLLLQVDNP